MYLELWYNIPYTWIHNHMLLIAIGVYKIYHVTQIQLNIKWLLLFKRNSFFSLRSLFLLYIAIV